MSAISNLGNRTNYVDTLTDELQSHHLEPKNSKQYIQQEKRIVDLIVKILKQENSLDGCLKESLLDLRRVLFVLNKGSARRIDKKIAETLQSIMILPSERKLHLTRASWNNFWSTYDEFVKLFPPG